MLDNFFGSRARVKILKAFLLHPDQVFYLRQLARDLDLQVNSVRRELKNLEDLGLLLLVPIKKLKSEAGEAPKNLNFSTDKKYYQINQSFILYPEIKALILKSQILAGKNFVEDLESVAEPKLLILTGIFVGQADMPTDMLVVGKASKTKFVELIKKLEHSLGKEINYTLLDEAEFEYRREIADVFLHNILESKKLVLLNKLNLSFSKNKNYL